MRIDAPIDPVAHVAIPSLRALARRAVPQALEARSFALRCTSSPHAWPELASRSSRP